MTKHVTSLQATPLIPHAPMMSSVRKPGQLVCPTGLVFATGEKFMRRFLAKLISSHTRDNAERFALLEGPPGTGKTVLATDACLRAGFSVFNLPAASLAGATENAAVEVLRS